MKIYKLLVSNERKFELTLDA